MVLLGFRWGLGFRGLGFRFRWFQVMVAIFQILVSGSQHFGVLSRGCNIPVFQGTGVWSFAASGFPGVGVWRWGQGPRPNQQALCSPNFGKPKIL